MSRYWNEIGRLGRDTSTQCMMEAWSGSIIAELFDEDPSQLLLGLQLQILDLGGHQNPYQVIEDL